MRNRATAFFPLLALGLTASACDSARPTGIAPVSTATAAAGIAREQAPGSPDSRAVVARLTAVNTQLAGVAKRFDAILFPPGPPNNRLLVLRVGVIALDLHLVAREFGAIQCPPGPPDQPIAEQLQGIVETAVNIAGAAVKMPPGPPDLKTEAADISATAQAIAAGALKVLGQQ